MPKADINAIIKHLYESELTILILYIKDDSMLLGLLILIGCQLTGEIVVGLTGIPVPGSVLGMLLLFIGLLIKGNVPTVLDITSNGLIKNIGLLFVPAGAGISLYIGLIVEQWNIILVASVTSTVVTLIVCAFIFQSLNKEP